MKSAGLIAILTLAFGVFSAPAGPSPVHRMSQLEEVKKRAVAEGKPIAWIGTFAKELAPYDKLMGKSSHAATAYAIRALQNDAILIHSDSETENHKEPGIVDHELHTPNPHYQMDHRLSATRPPPYAIRRHSPEPKQRWS